MAFYFGNKSDDEINDNDESRTLCPEADEHEDACNAFDHSNAFLLRRVLNIPEDLVCPINQYGGECDAQDKRGDDTP